MLRIGLYGINGHQLPLTLPAEVRAQVVAVAGFPEDRLVQAGNAVRIYPSLEEMLQDPEIDLISLCSPMRSEQASHAIQCLQAGKHVLAEKPSAFSDAELDRILETEQSTGRVFREMGGTQLMPSTQAIRRLVDSGDLGTIVQVQAQKSYPWHDARPQDTNVDGGLIRQVGIHAMKYIIGTTGLKVTAVNGYATGLGNPGSGDIHIAASFACMLENGAVASVNLNYLNPKEFGAWGNDQVRVFGTKGMVETVDGLERNSLFLDGRESKDLPIPEDIVSPDYLYHYVNYLLDGTEMPIPVEEDIAALRAINAAYEAAVSGRMIRVSS